MEIRALLLLLSRGSPGMKLRSSGLAAGPLHLAVSIALFVILINKTIP